MTRARIGAIEYDVVNMTDDAEWVLRDDHGDITLVDADAGVEVRCDRCGRFTTQAIPVGPRWVCADRECYEDER